MRMLLDKPIAVLLQSSVNHRQLLPLTGPVSRLMSSRFIKSACFGCFVRDPRSFEVVDPPALLDRLQRADPSLPLVFCCHW